MLKIESLAGEAPAHKASLTKEAPSAAAEEEARADSKKPALRSMKKAELIEFANEHGIEIDEKATNAVLIETIEAAL